VSHLNIEKLLMTGDGRPRYSLILSVSLWQIKNPLTIPNDILILECQS